MFKQTLILILLVGLVSCARSAKDRAKAAAKNKAKDAALDKARDRAGDLDIEAVKAKAKGGRFKDLVGGKNLSKAKLLKMGIHLPSGQKASPKACTTAPFGESPGMSKIRRNGKNKFYVCAWVNFQHHVGEDKATPEYNSDTVDMRFDLFKSCVDEVNRLNKQKDSTSTAGINFFCDMTEEEKRPYFNGIIMPS